MEPINEIKITVYNKEAEGNKEREGHVFEIEQFNDEDGVSTLSDRDECHEDRIVDAIDVLWCTGGTGKSQVDWILFFERFAKAVISHCADKKEHNKELFEKYANA